MMPKYCEAVGKTEAIKSIIDFIESQEQVIATLNKKQEDNPSAI